LHAGPALQAKLQEHSAVQVSATHWRLTRSVLPRPSQVANAVWAQRLWLPERIARAPLAAPLLSKVSHPVLVQTAFHAGFALREEL